MYREHSPLLHASSNLAHSACVYLIIESTKSEITAFLFDDMLLLTLTKGAKKGNRLRVGKISFCFRFLSHYSCYCCLLIVMCIAAIGLIRIQQCLSMWLSLPLFLQGCRQVFLNTRAEVPERGGGRPN